MNEEICVLVAAYLGVPNAASWSTATPRRRNVDASRHQKLEGTAHLRRPRGNPLPFRSILHTLERQKPVEEGAIAFEALAEIFGGDIVSAVPLFFEFGALLCELLCDALDHGGDQGIGLLDCVARLVDE